VPREGKPPAEIAFGDVRVFNPRETGASTDYPRSRPEGVIQVSAWQVIGDMEALGNSLLTRKRVTQVDLASAQADLTSLAAAGSPCSARCAAIAIPDFSTHSQVKAQVQFSPLHDAKLNATAECSLSFPSRES
jgi:hypothetical protein